MAGKITPRDALLRANANYDAFGDTAAMLATDPRLTGDERQVILKARDIAIKRRLRDEHPVLSRFIDFVEGRGQPLSTKKDWQTLVTLLGPGLSEAEKDALDLLAKKELFTSGVRDQYFTPFRNDHQDKRIAHVKSVGIKSGAGRVSTMIANMGVALGTSLVFPPALLAVIPAQIIAQRKIDTAITNAKADALGSFGVNRFKNEEVDDEARLILSHLAKGTGLDGTTATSLIESAEADAALVRNLQKTAGPSDESAETKRLAKSTSDYATALEGLIAKHKAKPMTADQLRSAIWNARADALSPEVIRAAMVQTVRAAARPMWPELELAFADVQEQAMAVAASALAPGGLATQEQRASLEADAAAFLKTVEAVKDRAPDLINAELRAFFTDAYANPTTVLQSDAAKKLAAKLEQTKQAVKQTGADLEAKLAPINREQAEEIGLEVAQSVFGQIMPRYIGETEKSKLKVTGATKGDDGSYDVTVAFKRGMFGGTEGHFSVRIGKDGMADAGSIQMRVDGDRATDAAKTVVEAYDRAFSSTKGVDVGAIRNPQRKDSDPFEIGGSLGDGARRFKITVTADGLPDRRSLHVS